MVLSYAISYFTGAIYWMNHHHLLHAAKHTTSRLMWWNTLLLFSLSFMPASTAWMGRNTNASAPTAVFCMVLLVTNIVFTGLSFAVMAQHPAESPIVRALSGGWKNIVALLLSVAAVGTAFWNVWVARTFLLLNIAMWVVPDTRIENALAEAEEGALHINADSKLHGLVESQHH